MKAKEILFNNIDKIHTMKLGRDRIRKNLELDTMMLFRIVKKLF